MLNEVGGLDGLQDTWQLFQSKVLVDILNIFQKSLGWLECPFFLFRLSSTLWADWLGHYCFSCFSPPVLPITVLTLLYKRSVRPWVGNFSALKIIEFSTEMILIQQQRQQNDSMFCFWKEKTINLVKEWRKNKWWELLGKFFISLLKSRFLLKIQKQQLHPRSWTIFPKSPCLP